MKAARHRIAIASLLLIAIATAAAIWWRRDPPIAPTDTNQPPAQAPAEAAAAILPAAEATPAERAEATPSPTPPVVDPLLAHVRGRCVDESGAPLAACKVDLGGWGRNSNATALQGEVDWHDPAPIVTGDDGRFDFAIAPPSGLQFSLDIASDGRVPRTGRWSGLQPAQVVDLGDIPLRRGFEVRGRVVDEQNTPVAKVGVSLRNLPLPIAPDMAANNVRYGFSGADGAFSIEVSIPVGTWSLDAETRGVRLVSPDRVVVTERGAEPVLVVVRRMPSIEGLVVDELGQPVQGVGVQAELHRSGRMASARSRQDGTFTIFAVDAEPKPVALRIDDPGPCEAPPPDPRLWEWGSKGVRFELRRAQSCELLVVERATGAPVTRYAVSCYHEKAGSSLFSDLRLSGDHPDGKVTIDRVWRGKNLLRVAPLAPHLLPSAMIEFEVDERGAPPLRVELERLRSTVVRLATVGGEPVVGSKVEVVKKGSEPFTAGSWAQDSRGGNRGFSSDPRHRFHELLATAVSAADGRATLYVPDDTSGVLVRATGAHPVAIVDPATFVDGQDLVVTVPEGGAIAGTLLLNGLDRARIVVVAMLRNSKQQGREQEFTIAADGTFNVRGLTPGSYELLPMYIVEFRTGTSGQTGRVPLPITTPPIEVVAGQTTAATIDGTALAPATVRGRALLDGAAPTAGRVVLAAEKGGRYGQFVLGPDGSFEATDLLPGTYRVDLVMGDLQASHGQTIGGDESFELASGQQFARDFVFQRRQLVVTLLQSDGKTPAAGVACSVRDDRRMRQSVTTDPAGRFVVDPAPTGPIRIHAAGTDKPFDPVQIPVGKAHHEVTLTLPKPAPK